MGMNFPDLPTNGQVFGLYTYDGEKWVFTSGPGGITQADADARYVNVTGDHMSGALIIDAATGSTSPTTGALVVGGGAGIGGAVRLNQAPGVLSVGTPLGSNAAVSVQFNPASWSGIEISSSSTGTAAGILHVFNNAATPWSWTWAASQAAINVSGPWKYIDTTASSSPTTGALTVAGGVGVGGDVRSGGSVVAGSGAYFFDNTATKYLSYDATGGNFYLTKSDASGAFLISPSSIFLNYTSADPANGTIYFNGSATRYLTYNGTFIFGGAPLNVPATTASSSPTTGALTVAGGVGVSGALNVGSNINANGGTYYFGNTGTKYLNYDGTNFNLTGGPFIVNSYINSVFSAATGSIYFGNVGNGKYLNYDGGSFNLVGGPLNVVNKLTVQTPSAGGVTPPIGYAFSIAYGGGTEFGIEMRAASDVAGYAAIAFHNSAAAAVGSITCSLTTTSYGTSSSAELKEDLKTFDAGNIVDNTDVYDFKWKSTGERAYGVIAQQAETVYPTAVTHTVNPQNKDEEFWGVDYSKYVPVILQELKALRARVRELEGGLEGKPS